MKKRKKLTRREKEIVAKAVAEAINNGDTEIEVKTYKRTYNVKIADGKAILPSGKAFEIHPGHGEI